MKILYEDAVMLAAVKPQGMPAPKGIKPAELDALRVLFKKICEDPEYLADMKKAGQPAEYMDGEAFAAYIAGQQAHAQEALSAAGLLKK